MQSCPRLPQDQAPSTPEVKEVADFMEFMLGDCSGDEDSTFLTLRVHVTKVCFKLFLLYDLSPTHSPSLPLVEQTSHFS